MIDQDKLKTMTKLALYEKKKGKKDFDIYSYDKEDYLRFQGLKTFILVTVAFAAVLGMILVWKLDYVLNHFDELNYGMIIFLSFVLLAVVVGAYLFFTYRKSKEEYEHMSPRIRRYQRRLKLIKSSCYPLRHSPFSKSRCCLSSLM